jgi:hypothetical protein
VYNTFAGSRRSNRDNAKDKENGDAFTDLPRQVVPGLKGKQKDGAKYLSGSIIPDTGTCNTREIFTKRKKRKPLMPLPENIVTSSTATTTCASPTTSSTATTTCLLSTTSMATTCASTTSSTATTSCNLTRSSTATTASSILPHGRRHYYTNYCTSSRNPSSTYLQWGEKPGWHNVRGMFSKGASHVGCPTPAMLIASVRSSTGLCSSGAQEGKIGGGAYQFVQNLEKLIQGTFSNLTYKYT